MVARGLSAMRGAWFALPLLLSPPLSAAAKVMLGGALVLAAGVLIGGG